MNLLAQEPGKMSHPFLKISICMISKTECQDLMLSFLQLNYPIW